MPGVCRLPYNAKLKLSNAEANLQLYVPHRYNIVLSQYKHVLVISVIKMSSIVIDFVFFVISMFTFPEYPVESLRVPCCRHKTKYREQKYLLDNVYHNIHV